MANETGGLPVLANPFALDVFADEAISFDNVFGTIRITFAAAKPIEPAPPSDSQFVTVGRLIMTVPGAQRLALSLYDYLKKHGLDPSEVVSEGQTAN